jgi:hypothetical protein
MSSEIKPAIWQQQRRARSVTYKQQFSTSSSAAQQPPMLTQNHYNQQHNVLNFPSSRKSKSSVSAPDNDSGPQVPGRIPMWPLDSH